ncbi:GntR family transcriptional regulator [Planobispora rosea]|uniref:GntR family transcriptional regulator n=1 Tax=Planobispora rosea TaxID=35762 RepID=A0A8J3WEG7_PLARO|nr:GntR family transcriptional regulator [Planobispora rosea]
MDAMARWEEIAAVLRERIRTGHYRPGDTIPKEKDLQVEFTCSRTPVRQAVAALTAEGLLQPVRRGGTKVQRRLARQPITLDFTVGRDERGYYFGTATQPWRALETPAVTEEPCPPDLAQVLDVQPGAPVVIRDRVMGDPETREVMQVATSYLPADLAAGTVLAAADTGPGGIYDRMERDLGWGPLQWRLGVSSHAASPDEVRLLSLAPGVPVLCVTRTTTATTGPVAGRVVEVNVTRRDASRFELGSAIVRR